LGNHPYHQFLITRGKEKNCYYILENELRRIEKDKSFASKPMKCMIDGIHQAPARPKIDQA